MLTELCFLVCSSPEVGRGKQGSVEAHSEEVGSGARRFSPSFSQAGAGIKSEAEQTSPNTCSEPTQAPRPLSGTSRSLQIPGNLRSHRARRGQARRHTGDVSLCVPPQSMEDVGVLREGVSCQDGPVSRALLATGHSILWPLPLPGLPSRSLLPAAISCF